MAGMRVSLSDALKTFNNATTLNLRFEMPALTARAGPLSEPARLGCAGFFDVRSAGCKTRGLPEAVPRLPFVRMLKNDEAPFNRQAQAQVSTK